jgi:hypothetical protein
MRNFLIASMVLALAACSSADDESGQSAVQAGSRPAVIGDESVAAVQESPGAPVAQLRFLIDTRPVVGKPFSLKLLASSPSPVPGLRMTVDSIGLELDTASADLGLELEGSADDATRSYATTHELAAVAREVGLAEVFVRLSAGADTPETLYVIPVLVAKAESEAAAGAASDKPDPAAESDNGQP